jgi:hypothetical protein
MRKIIRAGSTASTALTIPSETPQKFSADWKFESNAVAW